MELEITDLRELTREQAALIDMHSVVNIINVLVNELEYLQEVFQEIEIYANASILPPQRNADEGLVGSYLSDPLTGLPDSPDYDVKDYGAKLRLDYVAPPSVGVSVGGPFGGGAYGGVGFFFSDMLGNHNLWAKRAFFESSARIPMTLVDFGRSGEVPAGKLDDRLVCMQDVMPTLLELSDIEVPDTVEGVSMISGRERKVVYGEHGEGAEATRMIRDRKHKLLYFPAGNRVLLFDMSRDSKELYDLSSDPKYTKVKEELLEILIENIYGDDLTWLTDGALTGIPEPAEDFFIPKPGLDMQRGTHWPPPPYKMMDVEARN